MSKDQQDDIEFFPHLVVRTPGLPLSSFKSKSKEKELFKKILSNPSFSRALFLANAKVFRLAQAWMEGKDISDKDLARLRKTIYNYWTRMHSYCSPFGFFADVAYAKWGKQESAVKLKDRRVYARLDMELLHRIVEQLHQVEEIRKNIKYYTNTTSYILAGKIRYNEIFFDNNRINYKLSAVEQNEVIQVIMQFAQQGKTVQEIVDHLQLEDHSYEEVEDFVFSLVKEQLLLSTLSMNVTGQEPLKLIKQSLQQLDQALDRDVLKDYINYLEKTHEYLTYIEEAHDDFITHFYNLKTHLESRLEKVDEKKMIQIDSFAILDKGVINKNLQKSLAQAIRIISTFQQNDYLPYLEKFKRSFSQKYEGEVVPLMEAIDTESGVSFGDFSYIDENIFSGDLHIDSGADHAEGNQDHISALKLKIYRRYIKSLQNHQAIIELKDRDLDGLTTKVSRLSGTYQVIFNHLSKKNDLVSLVTIGNSGAGNLIARFTAGHSEIEKCLFDITDYEAGCYNNCIVAEVVHIPEYRIGNISFRAATREYEIPIMTKSTLNHDKQITLDDLYVSVINNKIMLFSKKHNKRVIPKLTNAHNYGKNTLPVYQFLSELSYQDIVPSLSSDTGIISDLGKRVPRIQYKNVIISKAAWKFSFEELKELKSAQKKLDKKIIKEFRDRWHLPTYTEYYDDNRPILVAWNDVTSVKYMLEKIKNKMKTFYFTEIVFDKEEVAVTDIVGNKYYNQCIAFVKNKARAYDSSYMVSFIPKNEPKRKYFPGEEWNYFKIYCGRKTYEKLLCHIVQPLVQELKAKKLLSGFFYLPFNDPNFHLRLRFRTKTENAGAVFSYITKQINQSSLADLIDKVQLDTYRRELERYGGHATELAEQFFEIDSHFSIDLLRYFEDNKSYIPLLVINQMDTILEAFARDFDFKYELLHNIRNAYNSEFGMEKGNDLWIRVADKMKEYRPQIEQAIEGDFPMMNDEIISAYQTRLKQFGKDIHALYLKHEEYLNDEQFLKAFIRSLLHMHAIRCFPDRPRQNELFVYNALFNLYRKRFYINKKNTK